MIILAIESAIAGGSISLLDEGREIAHWIGTSNVSKAEELLVNIDKLLASNNIQRNEIGQIAVSAGPGSFTGIRIGIATALGLKTGLNILMSSESALKAMAFTQPDNEEITVALPMGRSAVCLQAIEKRDVNTVAIDEPRTMSEDAFLSLIKDEVHSTFVLHSTLYEKAGHEKHTVNFGANVAHAVGITCRENVGILTQPLFVSKSF